MKKDYKTFFRQKWMCFSLAIIFYFLPFIIVTACLLPLTVASEGMKWGIGMGIVLINAIPFLMGVFRAFFAHFPMLNILSFVFLTLAAFFMLDYFRYYAEIFLWIEFAAALGSIASCICWGLFRKYSNWRESIKANIKSGAFITKGGDDK